MDLYTVYYGKAKNKITQKLMTGKKHQCENYVKQREHSVSGFHSIVPAEKGEKASKAKNKWKTGYVSGGSFHDHT